jgi:hypothetical protein
MDQKTIIQHALQFTDAKECFESFRLVSKFFQDAVETIKFNREVDDEIFEKLAENEQFEPPYVEKYLKIFRKFSFPILSRVPWKESADKICRLIANNMKKLNYICLNYLPDSFPDSCDLFISQILENSRTTLQEVHLPRFCIPDVCFPKLKTLQLEVGKDIKAHEFQAHFENALNNMERLEKVEVYTHIPSMPEYGEVCEYIGEKYGKHCISADHSVFLDVLNLVPVEILTFLDLEELNDAKYTSTLRYFHVTIEAESPMTNDWDNYKQILDQFPNLEAIELNPLYMGSNCQNFVTDVLPNISELNKKIWKERISYFKKRGIKIVEKEEINKNEAL